MLFFNLKKCIFVNIKILKIMNYKTNIVGSTELSRFTDFQLSFIIDTIIDLEENKHVKDEFLKSEEFKSLSELSALIEKTIKERGYSVGELNQKQIDIYK